MSQGKGDRNRSTGPLYSQNYNDINWDNKKNPHKEKIIKNVKDWAEELNIHPDHITAPYPLTINYPEPKGKK